MRLIDVVGMFLRRAIEGDDWDEAEQEVVESMLFQGYDPAEINTAVSVVHRIREQIETGPYLMRPVQSDRLFQFLEETRLTRGARGYLLELVHRGVISPLQREEIVEKTFLIDSPEIDTDEIRYVVDSVLSGESFIAEDSDGPGCDWYH